MQWLLFVVLCFVFVLAHESHELPPTSSLRELSLAFRRRGREVASELVGGDAIKN